MISTYNLETLVRNIVIDSKEINESRKIKNEIGDTKKVKIKYSTRDKSRHN